jgi:hypothetical protein
VLGYALVFVSDIQGAIIAPQRIPLQLIIPQPIYPDQQLPHILEVPLKQNASL